MIVQNRCVAANEKASSQSSDKLLRILECIAHNRMPVRLQDLAEQANMSQSTVLRYLNALLSANYVYQEEDTLRYALTWKICGLGQNLNTYSSLRNIASPYVNKLSAELNLGSCLVIDHDFECMYLDCIDVPTRLTHTLQRIGKCAPLHTTGSGKVLLASYNDVKVDEYINTKGLSKVTDYTITSREDLFSELDRVRAQGYGIDEEECEVGLRCISTPLYRYDGNVAAALSVFGSTSTLTHERINSEVYPLLKSTAITISLRLGYKEEDDPVALANE